jgi:uncharacterized iron-regulated membrane protein
MASQRTTRILLSVHGWAGIVTGLLMFIVCLSGAIVVFKHEIDLWANPAIAALPKVDDPVGLQQVHDAISASHPSARIESIWPPDAVTPVFMVFVRHPDQRREKIAVTADHARVLGPVESQLGQYLRSLHVFLFVGPRWIVGFLGVVMLVLIATGIVIHKKIIAELFTHRWQHSLRTLFSDTHKAAAIWGLLFHIVIAFTGAWLGLKPVFVGAWQAVVPSAASVSPQSSRSASPAPTAIDLDRLALTAQRAVPGMHLRFVSILPGAANGPAVRFSGPLPDHLASNAFAEVSITDGRVVAARDPRRAGFWSVVDGLMEPLHFGDFGGLWLKWLYFVLGLSPAFLSLTGTLLWLDKRREAGVRLSHASA